MEKRNLTLKDSTIAFIMAFACSQLMIIFGQLILSVVLSIFDYSAYKIAHFFDTPLGYLIVASFQFIAFVGVFVYYHKKTNVTKECLKEKLSVVPTILFIFAGLATMFLLNHFINYCTLFLNLLNKPTATISYGLDSISSYLISIISLCVFPAIGEELIFRGLIFNSLKTKSKTLAICLSSVMFALFHFNLSQLFYPILFGLVLSIAYLYTKNLFVPILIHFFNNFVNITLQYIGKATTFNVGLSSFFIMLICVILWIALVALLFIFLTKKELKYPEEVNVEIVKEEKKSKKTSHGSYLSQYKAIFKTEKFWFYFPLLFMVLLYIIINI